MGMSDDRSRATDDVQNASQTGVKIQVGGGSAVDNQTSSPAEAEESVNRLRFLEIAGADSTEDLLRAVFAEAYGNPPNTEAERVDNQSGVAPHSAGGVSVTHSDLIKSVYLDTAEDYSVRGYAERADKCFGRIYLCLDKGPEYDQQSGRVNAAVQSISAAESFAATLEATKAALVANPDAARNPREHIESVSIKVLAALCTLWFGLPNGVNVVEGGERESHSPPRCPGTFALPSAYIFKPDPSPQLIGAAQVCGGLLKDQVTAYVRQNRGGVVPPGSISQVIFEAFPGDDHLAAQTIIGVMMGKLPTIDHNLRNIGAAWSDAKLAELREALRRNVAATRFERATTVLLDPIMRTMQTNPVPDAVWRTAVTQHRLGGHILNPGDRVRLDIAAATRRDLENSIVDITPVFGGTRDTQRPHPTHACPGYEMAIGVLLGVFSGLLDEA